MSDVPKIIAVVGPTSSGKTTLSLTLAKKFNGEIISADSRQFYKKMDIATSKPAGEWRVSSGESVYVVDGIPHHLMDIVDPGKEISMAQFKEMAFTAIKKIVARGKVPFLVGGTGLYVWGVIDNLEMPRIPPNKKLRSSLEQKPLPELLLLLEKMDPLAYQAIDRNNPRRVLRALEVAILSGESFFAQRKKAAPVVEALQLAITWDLPTLYQRIDATIDEQVRRGLVEETLALMKQRYGWNLPSMSSIGYRHIASYLDNTITLDEAVQLIKRDTHRYAKRQLTWFKRDKRIVWLPGVDETRAEELVQDFLKTT